MSKSKGKNISVAMKPAMQEQIEKIAVARSIEEGKPVSKSKVVQELVEKYLNPDGEFNIVIIKVPSALRGDQENLRKWLDFKINGIVSVLGKC